MKRGLFTLLLLAAGLSASSTATWEMNTFADFARGKLSGLSLSRDGRLALGPKTSILFSSEQPSIWSVAAGPDGSVYAATGHRGRVFRVDPTGKGALLWSAPEPEVFAISVGRDGAVYAATSPDGRVYRIQNGKATEYFHPHTRYIWSLAFGPDGALYVGTGEQGKIFRVASSGAGELWYESGQQHITALAFDGAGRLLAGSEPNGLLYRVSAKNQAFVLYDSSLPEIRAMAVGEDGAIYASALGGSVAQRAGVASGAVQTTTTNTTVTAPPTSITVTDESRMQGGLEIKPKPPTEAQKTSVTATITPGTTVYTAPQAELTGVEKSALYRINPDNTVDTLWSSREENLYDFTLAANREIVFATDTQGRMYRLTPDRRLTLLVQTSNGETTRILPNGESLITATSNSGQLLQIGNGFASKGTFEAPVHDAGSVAKWGQLSWRGQRLSQGRLQFQTRAGNSARPDNTWSEWSQPLSEPDGTAIPSPNARFVQWRAEFSSNGSESPAITGVALSYLPQNNSPSVRSINVITQIVPASSTGLTSTSAQQTAGSAYSITVTDSPDSGASTLSGTPTQTVSRGLAQQIQITWQADDPDGDKLVYSAYFRGEDETRWKALRTNISENLLTLEGDVLADGKYFFRVVASDRMANPVTSARDSELVSPPVLFDNTPPVVKATGRRDGNRLEITAEATDTSSALRRAEYSMDASAWFPLDSVDGVVDGRLERFVLTLNNVTPSEHVVVVRVFDSSNNSGLMKVVLPVAGQ